MAGWAPLADLLREEFKQRREEGCDPAQVADLQAKFAALGPDPDDSELQALYDQLMDLPVSPDFPFDEPSDLPSIRQARKDGPRRLTDGWQPNQLDDYMYGAWLGRLCGCALGKPLEIWSYMHGRSGRRGWEVIRDYLTGADAWPLNDYVPGKSTAPGLEVRCPASQRENIRFMETDDDVRYTVLGLHIMETYGPEFTTLDVVRTWMSMLPIELACTAERQAYLNLANRYIGHGKNLSEADLEYARMYRNPYREWIGAQIRADGFAYAAAGWPELAAEFAWRDARLSHVKNGIYGEMLIAAMIAAAFVEKDIRPVVEIGLSEIPAGSRLYRDVEQAVEIASRARTQEELFTALWDAFGHYNPVHTNNNAALVVAALIYAQDDFSLAIATAVAGGWDTDCNGATVGSIWGAMYGASAIPKRWSEPLHDTLYSAIPGFHPIAISECARRSVATAERVWRSVGPK